MVSFLRKEKRPPTGLLDQYSPSFAASQVAPCPSTMNSTLSIRADFHQSATGPACSDLAVRWNRNYILKCVKAILAESSGGLIRLRGQIRRTGLRYLAIEPQVAVLEKEAPRNEVALRVR
jgi:hypothetical protein